MFGFVDIVDSYSIVQCHHIYILHPASNVSSTVFPSIQCLLNGLPSMWMAIMLDMALRLRIITLQWWWSTFGVASVLFLAVRRRWGPNASLQPLAVQAKCAPFRYDDYIEKHLCAQHQYQWDQYSGHNSGSERDAFFCEAPAEGVFKNSIKSHFASESLDAEQQKVYDIEEGNDCGWNDVQSWTSCRQWWRQWR